MYNYCIYDMLASLAGWLIALIIVLSAIYVQYLIVTWPDRKRERTVFRLRVLRFALDNGLDDGEIADALCGEFRWRRHIADRIRRRLAEGWPLPYALGEGRRIFPRSVSSILKAGEKMDNLPDMASYTEIHTGLDRSIYGKINMQLLYPLSLIAYPGMVFSLVYIFVYPQFYEMAGELGMHEKLQWFVPGRLSLLLWGAVALCTLSYLWFRFRLASRKNDMTFIHVLSSALSHGIDESAALELAGCAAGSGTVQRRSRAAQRQLAEGCDVSAAVAASFPNSGDMQWFFNQSRPSGAGDVFGLWAGILRDRMNRQADVFAQSFSTLIVLCVGVCVGSVMVSVFHFLIALATLLM